MIKCTIAYLYVYTTILLVWKGGSHLKIEVMCNGTLGDLCFSHVNLALLFSPHQLSNS